MNNKKVFITFEGGEGCGKSTISKMLANFFNEKQIDCLLTREPGGNAICEAIRNVVLHCDGKMSKITQALLFYASRGQLVEDVIAPALNDGKIVICDRFFDSTYVYQGYAGGLNEKYIDDLTAMTCKNAIPTITFFMDIEPELAFERKGGRDATDRFEMENLDFHKKVREGFLYLANKNKSRFRIIDASKGVDEVFAQVLKILKDERII